MLVYELLKSYTGKQLVFATSSHSTDATTRADILESRMNDASGMPGTRLDYIGVPK